MQEGNAAANMALLNKIALNLLRLSPTKAGIKARRKRADWEDKYLLTVLGKAQQIYMRLPWVAPVSGCNRVAHPLCKK
ncbi:hypothetical protein XBJ2_1320001 [Xenorhabdus bovienii str. Jollieti]|nr:hypothetical protein XBJ2_1320001 [Xenorhabdus bovienii str. Jollieti]